VQRVFFGPSREPPRGAGHGHASGGHASHADSHGHHHEHAAGHAAPTDRCDIRWHELVALAPLAVFVLWIGLAPATFLAPVAPAVRATTDAAAAAFTARMEAAPATDIVSDTPASSPLAAAP
jgi:NADH-quinone oxidoreductase subunit M